jgi:hypothetical protein
MSHETKSEKKAKQKEYRKNRYWGCDPSVFAPQVPGQLLLKGKSGYLLRPIDIAVVLALEYHRRTDKKTNDVAEWVWPSERRIASLVGASRGPVQRSLHKLAEHYGLKKGRQATSKGSRTKYHIAKFYDVLGGQPEKDLRGEKQAYVGERDAESNAPA